MTTTLIILCDSQHYALLADGTLIERGDDLDDEERQAFEHFCNETRPAGGGVITPAQTLVRPLSVERSAAGLE